jgi:hypothetical protein
MPTKRRASQWQNEWLALREAWWPLAVAVAWVLLRSRQVVQRLLDRHPRKTIRFISVAICTAASTLKALRAGGQHKTTGLENTAAAFRKLRYHLETGEIEIVGTPFKRVGLQGSRLETGNQQTISYAEISSLVPFNDLGTLCLIPRDWHRAHGSARTNLCGYRDVQVRSAALVSAFPEEREEEGRHAVRPLLLRKEAKEAASVASPSKKVPTVSLSDLTDWYTKTYIPGRLRSSREQDKVVADDRFKGFYVPRDWLRNLRRNHAPEAWRHRGRNPRA